MEETSFLALAHPVIVAWRVNHSWHASKKRNKLHSGGSSCNCCCFCCCWGCWAPSHHSPLLKRNPFTCQSAWLAKKTVVNWQLVDLWPLISTLLGRVQLEHSSWKWIMVWTLSAANALRGDFT